MDLIDRQAAIDALWKALYEYEDKTEKQFQESDELDVSDWIMNDRMWVQNGHNLCVDVLTNLPSAQQWIPCSKELPPYGKHVLTWWKGVIAIDCRVPGFEEYWLLNVEAWQPLPEPYKDGGQNETN